MNLYLLASYVYMSANKVYVHSMRPWSMGYLTKYFIKIGVNLNGSLNY